MLHMGHLRFDRRDTYFFHILLQNSFIIPPSSHHAMSLCLYLLPQLMLQQRIALRSDISF